MEQEITNVESKPKKSWLRWVLYGILGLVLMFIAVQFFNAAKYEALVQVIEEDKIGVSRAGEGLDFGYLPRDKSAVRAVTLESKGNAAPYVVVWKFGAIS